MIDDFRSLAPTYRPTPAGCTEGDTAGEVGKPSIICLHLPSDPTDSWRPYYATSTSPAVSKVRKSPSPETVDHAGNSILMRAACAAGVGHFILVSVQGAAPDHPMGLLRAKYAAEQELLASGLSWTILRPTASMETWARLVGRPLVETGKTRILGRGDNPINFVAADDVARFVELAVVDPALRGEAVDVGGPENLTFRQFARTFETVLGQTGKISHVPLPLMRALTVLLRPVNVTIARQIQAGVVMDTRDMTFDPAATVRRYPSIVPTRLAELVAREYAAAR